MVDLSDARNVLLSGGSPSSDTGHTSEVENTSVGDTATWSRGVCLTGNVVVLVPGHSAAAVVLLQGGLAAAAHRDLSRPPGSLDNGLGESSVRATEPTPSSVSYIPIYIHAVYIRE